ncbi:uncharacterized protein LOC144762776 isoform X6 [Lissotriton helveticus]
MFGAQRISFCQGQYKRTRPPFKCWFYHVRVFTSYVAAHESVCLAVSSALLALPELHVKSLFACSICEMELPLWKCNG